MVIYFSKINLESTQLLEMYKKEELFNDMRKSILSFFSHGTTYEVEESYKDVYGEVHTITTKYRLSIGMKADDCISGVIFKTTSLFYKKVNEKTAEIESHMIPTIEDVKFYFDINREIVGFHTRNRFGYQEFNGAFKGIINNCMEKNNLPLKFSVSLYNEGLEISEIEQELKQINNIKKLEFKFRLPNPADDHTIEKLKDGLTNTAEQLEEANAHAMSVIFDSDGNIGLNIDSGEIQKNIGRIGNLTSGINDKKATQNGYALVRAISKDGKIFTTEDRRPIKREVTDDESGETFLNACKETILNIFTKNVLKQERNSDKTWLKE